MAKPCGKEAQGTRSMAGILARKALHAACVAGHHRQQGLGTLVAVTPILVSGDIFPETSLMPPSILSSFIWDLHVADPRPAAKGWCVFTCSPGITGGISPGSRCLLLGCTVSHQLLALPFLVWAQADAGLLQHSSGASHCLFWRPGNKFVR